LNFLIFNAPLMLFTGYDRLLETTGALLVMGFIPYGILRRGRHKYEQAYIMQEGAGSQQHQDQQAATTLSHLLQQENQNQPCTAKDEQYMPPDMRTNAHPQGDETRMLLEMCVEPAYEDTSPTPANLTSRRPLPTSHSNQPEIALEAESHAQPKSDCTAQSSLSSYDKRDVACGKVVGPGYCDGEASESSCGGIGRLIYAIGVFALTIILICVRVVGERMASADTHTGRYPDFVYIASILYYVILLALVVARLHNMGTSGWWALLMFVPCANLLVGIPCLVCPAGYSYTKKLDVAAKSLICLLICLVVLFVVALLAEV